MIARYLPLFAALFFSTPLFAQRQTRELADGWKFIKAEVAPDAAVDASWKNVSVPHTWNVIDGQDGKAAEPQYPEGYYRGPGWYARGLDVPAAWKGKRVFIRFEAASLVADVYVNGQHLGQHRGGFTAFCYELTSLLRFDGKDALRVRVDNSHFEDVPPLSGDFTIFGGIYRPVHLLATDTACISPLDFASPGVYVTEKSVTKESASIEVKALVSNGGEAGKLRVEAEIKNAAGKSVAKLDSEQQVEQGKTEPVAQTFTIPTPHLWNGRKDAYLYSALVRVIRDGKTVDEVTQPLGIRTVQITEEKGFLLNDEPYPVHGVNRHQERKDKGWALSKADHDEDHRLMLDLGVTAIRLAHYPQSDYFHDLCDRSGLLLWNEVSLVNETRDKPEFAANAEQQFRELILQRYNHPSVTWWGLFNELDNKPTPHPEPLLERLKAVAKELDPSRLIVAASDHRKKAYNQIPDHLCYNAYPGWYGGTPEQMSHIINDVSAEFGGKRIAMSEYGAGGGPHQHQEGVPAKPDHKGKNHPEEWQDFVHEKDWAQMRDNPKLWGTFLWVMFDFASDDRNEGEQPGINDKGLVTHDHKLKKDAYYFYQANWTDKPMVYIASRRNTQRTQAATGVKVYSNCAEVELKVNGQSAGKVTPDEVRVCHWENVQLKPGRNRIEVSAKANGDKLTDTCEWTLQAAAATPAPGQPAQ